MKKLLCILILTASAFGNTTVTGNLKNLGTGNVTSTSGAFVRFWLRGCRGNQPRITGTGAIAPQLSGNTFYFDIPADSSGDVSGSLYSTRDAAGTGNGQIECGGSYTAVWYGMVVYNNGVPGPEVPIHAKSGASFDISNITPNTTQPVVDAPTGDTTYARTDAGNLPFTGNVTAKQIEQVRYADQYDGNDIGQRINAAFTDCLSYCTVIVPKGAYSFSTTINYPMATGGNASLVLEAGAALTYTGAGDAISVIPIAGQQVAVHAKIVGKNGSRLYCSGAGCATANGIHLKNFAEFEVSGLTIALFNYGIYNEGAVTGNIHSNDISSNNTAIYLTDTNYLGGSASNSIWVHHNQMTDNNWAVQEVRSASCGGCTQGLVNVYASNVIESNVVGGINLLNSQATVVKDNYLDGEPHYIVVGDGSNAGNGILITGNMFTTRSVGQASIELVNANDTVILGNTEINVGTTNTNFVSQTATARTWIGPNQTIATNKISADPDGKTYVWGDATHTNGLAPSTGGLTVKNWLVNGILATNSASRTGASAGDVVIRNGNYLRGNDNVNGNTYRLIGMSNTANNYVLIDPDGQGTRTRSLSIGASGSFINDSRELIQSAHSCGTTTTCANTANGSNFMIFGTATLSTGTATVTGISPAFTSTSSFVCTGTDQTSAAAVKIANASTSSITITGTGSDVIGYQCVGN